MDENWPDCSTFRHIILTWYKEPYKTKKLEKNDFPKRLKERLFAVSVQCGSFGHKNLLPADFFTAKLTWLRKCSCPYGLKS
jgi:hypothetical protein